MDIGKSLMPDDKLWHEILKQVVEVGYPEHMLSVEDIGVKSRRKELIDVRRMFYYILRTVYNLTYQQISACYYYAVGQKGVPPDHATIIYHCRLQETMMEVYPSEVVRYSTIIKAVRSVTVAPQSFLFIINREIERLYTLRDELLTNLNTDKNGEAKLEQIND